MTQFEQENDFGRGGGEVDDETMREAWQRTEEKDPNLPDAAEEADVDEDVERRA